MIHSILRIATCYSMWACCSGIVIWMIFRLRAVIDTFYFSFGTSKYLYWAVDRFGILVFGLAAVGVIVYIEDYLRNGMNQREFTYRAARVYLWGVLLAGISYAVQFAILRLAAIVY